jgi:hypothetical protein
LREVTFESIWIHLQNFGEHDLLYEVLDR